MQYVLIFCRFALATTFLIAFFAKVRRIDAFRQAIASFKILPQTLHYPAAILLLISEITLALLLLVGEQWLTFGFVTAIVQLSGFTSVLLLTLIRQIQTSCNCFGTSAKPISRFDIARNLALIVCALLGLVITTSGVYITPVALFESALTVTAALIVVLIILNLEQVMKLLR